MPEICSRSRLKVLFLPAWYPSETNPVEGIFVKEHAKAASLFNDIVVLYAYGDPSPGLKGLYRVSEDVEDGIRTIRVRYGGILFRTKRWLAERLVRKTKRQSGSAQHSTASRAGGALSKPIRIFSTVVGYLLYYGSIFATFRKLVREGWRPDVIHAHVFTAGVPAVILGKFYKIPVVVTEHTTNVATHSLGSLEQKRLRFVMERAQIILPVSDDLRRAIENYYGIKNKFCVVPNVVNTEVFYPLTFRAENKEHSKKRMLLLANLIPRKGIPYLLEALSQVKDIRQDFIMDIVGDGPNRAEYEELARNLGLGNIVKFHGRQPQIISFMRDCDFFVLPSVYENFGVVYIEAMACGKPVIAANAGGPKEIVTEDVGILVPPKDVEALAHAIEHMLDNYTNYSPRKIAQYAGERFGYEAVGNMLDKVYREVFTQCKQAEPRKTSGENVCR